MRNLKKVLSLTLALVMLLGMMVVGAGAATEYKDADTIKNTEAVAVLTKIGVVEGTDGNFNPEKVLDRAEGAAIIYRLLTGGTVKNPSAGATGFVDVDSDANYTWAMGIIADLAQKGIISGEDPTHFNPSGELTGAAFSKMLLVALGYNAETQGYVGGGWEGNVIRDAYSRGINVDGVVMTNKITRDQAAQMAFQTLTAPMVSQRGGIQIGEVVIPGYAPTELGMEFREVYFTALDVDGTEEDAYGAPANKWVYNKEDIITASKAPAVKFTGSVSQAAAAKALKGYTLDQTSGLTPMEDGAASSTTGLKKITADQSSNDLALYIKTVSGSGVEIRVYADDEDEITDVIVINTYLGQVSRVRTADDKTTVTVSKKAGGTKTASTFETSAFEKDEYVLYTVGTDGIATMTAAEKVTGTVTATATGYVRVDGERYDYAKNSVIGADAAVKNDVDLYLNAEGDVMFVVKVSGEVVTNYLYVKGVDRYFDTISIRAVFSDGTTKVVELDGNTMVRSDSTNEGIAASNAVDNTPTGATYIKLSAANNTLLGKLVDPAQKSIANKAYAYTEKDGKVKLTSAAVNTVVVNDDGTSTTNGATKEVAITKGNSPLYTAKVYSSSSSNWASSATASDVVVDSNTTYVMVADGKTYTGFRNVPSMTGVDMTYVVNKNNAKLVDLVFITDATPGVDENATSTFFYVKDNTKFETFEDYILWTDAYIDGEKAEVKTTTDIDESDITAAGLYKATATTEDGYFSTVNSVIATSAITGVSAEVASNGTLFLSGDNINNGGGAGTGRNYSYTDETLFVVIDKDGNVSPSNDVPMGLVNASPVDGDSVYAVYVATVMGTGKDATVAKTVYVKESTYVAPKTAIDSVTINGAVQPVKDQNLVAPTLDASSAANVEIKSYKWNNGSADVNAGTAAAGGTTYTLTIVLGIKSDKTATHEFGTMNNVKIGSVTGVWTAGTSTLVFTFAATEA